MDIPWKPADGTTFQYSGTESKGIRSDKLALVASIIIDGGISYMLYMGLNALFGQKQDKKNAEQLSKGYNKALEDMQRQERGQRSSEAKSPVNEAAQENEEAFSR